MDDPRRELGDLARLMSGLVRWDMEDDALGYSRAAEREDDTGGISPTMHPLSEGTPQLSTSDLVAQEQRSQAGAASEQRRLQAERSIPLTSALARSK